MTAVDILDDNTYLGAESVTICSPCSETQTEIQKTTWNARSCGAFHLEIP